MSAQTRTFVEQEPNDADPVSPRVQRFVRLKSEFTGTGDYDVDYDLRSTNFKCEDYDYDYDTSDDGASSVWCFDGDLSDIMSMSGCSEYSSDCGEDNEWC